MKNRNFGKFLLMWLAVFGAGAILMDACSADTGDQKTADVLLTIDSWHVTIGIEGTATLTGIDLWHMNPSFVDQDMSGTFGQDFWVEDLKWWQTGYYTTVQASDLTWVHEGTNYIIPASNVKFKSNTYSLLAWTGNDALKNNLDSVISGAQTYFDRHGANQGTPGLLWKYGDKPTITVTVPANTPSAEYKGIITYTLYDLDN